MSSSEMLITQLLEIQSYPVESFPLYFVSPETSQTVICCLAEMDGVVMENGFHPNSVIANLNRIYTELDKAADGALYANCSAGCTDCCAANFDVSLVEFFYILHALRLQYSRKTIEQIISSFPMEIPLHRCVFVDDTQKRCKIYAVRPIICRKFGTFQESMCSRQIGKVLPLAPAELDTQTNVNLFHLGNKKLLPTRKPIVMWFSSVDRNGELNTPKMRLLYEKAFHANIEEYVWSMLT